MKFRSDVKSIFLNYQIISNNSVDTLNKYINMKNVNNYIVKDKWYFCMIIYNWTNWCIILQTVLINKEKNKVRNTKDQELVALFLSLLL